MKLAIRGVLRSMELGDMGANKEDIATHDISRFVPSFWM
jgi:hypothetical protein